VEWQGPDVCLYAKFGGRVTFADWMERGEREKIIGPWFRLAHDRLASSPRQQELFRLSSDGSGVLDQALERTMSYCWVTDSSRLSW
jgi:hypothetical protein